MRNPVLIFFLLVSMLVPLYSFQYDEQKDVNSSSAEVFLNADEGSYIAGFSSNVVNSWNTVPNEHYSVVRPVSVGESSSSITFDDVGYVFWKLRSTGKWEIYLAKKAEKLVEDTSSETKGELDWTVLVEDLISPQGGTFEINTQTSENGYGTKIYERNFGSQMATDTKSPKLTITVSGFDHDYTMTQRSYYGSLILTLKAAD